MNRKAVKKEPICVSFTSVQRGNGQLGIRWPVLEFHPNCNLEIQKADVQVALSGKILTLQKSRKKAFPVFAAGEQSICSYGVFGKVWGHVHNNGQLWRVHEIAFVNDIAI